MPTLDDITLAEIENPYLPPEPPEYVPYVPRTFNLCLPPNPVVQEVLQEVYGKLMHSIKSALDPFVHDLAEQAIDEFGYDEHGSHPAYAVSDYLYELESSEGIWERAQDIAPLPGQSDDIGTAMQLILNVAAETLKHHVRIALVDANTSVSEA